VWSLDLDEFQWVSSDVVFDNEQGTRLTAEVLAAIERWALTFGNNALAISRTNTMTIEQKLAIEWRDVRNWDESKKHAVAEAIAKSRVNKGVLLSKGHSRVVRQPC